MLVLSMFSEVNCKNRKISAERINIELLLKTKHEVVNCLSAAVIN